MSEPSITADAVLNQIRELYMENGQELTKKQVKQADPELMRSALWYYPSWDHALEKATELQ